jgi:hypothetical protein
METFELGWDDIGSHGAPDKGCDGDDGFLPLEFQLADLERAVDTMLQERDRFLYGDDYADAPAGEAPTGKLQRGGQRP